MRLRLFLFVPLLSVCGLASAMDAEPDFSLSPEEEALLQGAEVLPDLHAEILGEPVRSKTILLREVKLLGSSKIDAGRVQTLVAPYLNRQVSPEELGAIRQLLSAEYLNAGYLGSGVVIPPQSVENGVVRMQAMETRIGGMQISVSGLSERYVERRILTQVESPLRLQDVEAGLRLLQEHPLIARVNARLVDGTRMGDARLLLDVETAEPYRLTVGADNRRPPSLGGEQGVLDLLHRNLTGRRDVLSLRGSYADGFSQGRIDYALPVNLRDTTLSVGYEEGDSKVVEAPFDDIDIESDSRRWRVGVNHPIVHSLSQRWNLFANLTVSESETELLGRPFSFSLGVEEGESSTTVIEAGSDYLHRSADRLFAARFAVRQGLDAMGATSADRRRDLTTGAEIPDGEFTALLLQLQYAQNLAWLNSQIRANLVYQHAFDPLLVLEKIALGGFDTARGYRENSLVRDSGGAAGIEWRLPLFGNDETGTIYDLNLVTFFNAAWARDENESLPTGRGQNIKSVGMGLEWRPLRHFSLDVYYGHALDDEDLPRPSEYDWQDDGVHFSARWQWPGR